MLSAYRNLALHFLWNEFKDAKEPPHDLDQWFKEKKKMSPLLLLQYLVEDPGKVARYYTLAADEKDDSLAVLECRELKSEVDKKKNALQSPFWLAIFGYWSGNKKDFYFRQRAWSLY